ncbi:MAG: hypothetical protein LBF62_00260 [Tannerellaceae bacterium]|nr:hypothetical protein [Tannerellaceae bacterium]
MKNKLSTCLSQPAPVNDKPGLSVLLCVITVVFIYFPVMTQLPEYFPMGFFVDLFAVLTIGIIPLRFIT